MQNHLQLNVTRTKEMSVDVRRNKPPDVKIAEIHEYLGGGVNDEREWSANMEAANKEPRAPEPCLRRLSFTLR